MSGLAQETAHIPVLCAEVVAALAPAEGERMVDGTFGAGGYSRALLASPLAHLYAIDRDPGAVAAGRALLAQYPGRLSLICGRFGVMDTLLATQNIDALDGIALDIGVSSMQLDSAERGFSFQADGPLDMRMSQSGPTAADIVNSESAETLADIFYHLGEEPGARRIAKAVVARRSERPFTRTLDFADVVRAALGGRRGPKDPATRAFQALRIHVNAELDELAGGLAAAERLLSPGGRLAVVAFHSLEDRMVKQFLRTRSGATPQGSRHIPQVPKSERPATFTRVAKAIRPGEAEVGANPRARSAVLRAAVRTAAPAWEA